MAKIKVSFERAKNGVMVHMECVDKEDYLSTDIIPPDGSVVMKHKLHTKVSFVAKDVKQAKKIVNEKKEAIQNYITNWRDTMATLPAQNTYTI